VCTVPLLFEVGGVEHKQTLAVIDVELGGVEPGGVDLEAVVGGIVGGEDVGCPDGSSFHGDGAYGGVGACPGTDGEADHYAVDVCRRAMAVDMLVGWRRR